LKEKSITLYGKFNDLGDLLMVARDQGCKICGCSKVTVNPHILYFEEKTVVFVSPKDRGAGVQNSQVACEIKS
jgi:hypothetical protein